MSASPQRIAAIPMVFAIATSISCVPGDAPALPEYEVRDSAGVEIVHSGPPIHDDSAAWRVATEPGLQIGEREGELPYLFNRMRDAVRVPDGRVVIMDGQDFEVRVFGPDGMHQRSFGRRGDGPLEFGAWPRMTLAPPDSLVVWDPGHGRLSWFDLDGSLLRQLTFPAVVARLSALSGAGWQVRQDGSLLVRSPISGSRADGIQNRETRIGVIDDDGQLSHDFGTVSGGQAYNHPMGFSFSSWFGPSVLAALGPLPIRVALSSPEKWEVRFFSSGGELLRILRAPIPQVPVTAEVRDARRAHNEDIALRIGLTRGDAESMDDQMLLPDSLPAIARMMWDRADNLWVGRRMPNPGTIEDYDVFDSDGRWLSSVQIPGELGSILEIGEDYVLTVWSDELQVPYLRVHRLEKPGS